MKYLILLIGMVCYSQTDTTIQDLGTVGLKADSVNVSLAIYVKDPITLPTIEYVNSLEGKILKLVSYSESMSKTLETLSLKIEELSTTIKNPDIEDEEDDEFDENNLIVYDEISLSNWTKKGQESYYFDAKANYKYLHLRLSENLKVGVEYEIVFSIKNDLEDDSAFFKPWLYIDTSIDSDYEEEVFEAMKQDSSYGDGTYTMIFKVDGRERNKFSIRARNDRGGAFTIYNIYIKEK